MKRQIMNSAVKSNPGYAVRHRLAAMAFLLFAGVLIFPAIAVSPADLEGVSTDDFRTVIANAKKRVFPAVVFIKCVVDTHEGGEKRGRDVSGSGVIISPEGHILTNWHVAGRAREIRCQLFDGRTFSAQRLGSDKDVDLAVLQLELPEDADPVPYAALGDSSILQEGEFVMAMGAPWGMSRSVSIGIVSCARRYLPKMSEYSLWLQTDASISPGNSGGPLVNTQGEIVGINTLGAMIGGDMGFAIPSETIEILWPKLKNHGAVPWSWTGLQLQPIRDFVRNIYFEGDQGVMVADIDPDSPAAWAGVMPKDRIVSINGREVNALYEEGLPDVRRAIAMLPLDISSEFKILRGEAEITLDITPLAKGTVDGEELSLKRWDFSVKSINQFADPDLYFYRNLGVYIYGLRRPGNAASSGLSNKDIIVSIDGNEIGSLDDIRAAHAAALANLENSTVVRFKVLRNGMPRHFVLDFSRDTDRR